MCNLEPKVTINAHTSTELGVQGYWNLQPPLTQAFHTNGGWFKVLRAEVAAVRLGPTLLHVREEDYPYSNDLNYAGRRFYWM